MNDLEKALLTTFLTIISGTAVYATGNVFVRYFLEPVVELRKYTGEIWDLLRFYANVYTSRPSGRLGEDNKHAECRKAIRQAATKLMAKAHAVPANKLFSLLRMIPKRRDIELASKELIFISNSAGEDLVECAQAAKKVEGHLGLYHEAD